MVKQTITERENEEIIKCQNLCHKFRLHHPCFPSKFFMQQISLNHLNVLNFMIFLLFPDRGSEAPLWMKSLCHLVDW